MILANPQPLVIAVSKEHADKIHKEIRQLQQWNPSLMITSIHTDNENTMKSMRDNHFAEYSSPGCASHGAQSNIGSPIHTTCHSNHSFQFEPCCLSVV